MKNVPTLTLSRMHEREAEQKPLEFKLIRRLLGYTRPHAHTRNLLLMCVVARAIQLPLVAWSIGAVINGPITRHDVRGTILGALGFAALAAFTQFTFHFRQGLALELGESVVRDLRTDIFRHLLAMPLTFFNKTKIGWIISRFTSDVEAVRVGAQNVLFVTLVTGGQMLGAAALMAWYDRVLFLVVVAIAPVLWGLNRAFRTRFSRVTRDAQESFSRITATLAESVSGIRVTQGFVRQEVNADMFHKLVMDHSYYNMEVARTSGVFLPLLELNSQIFIAILLVLGGHRVLTPDVAMPVGTLIQFFFLANIFFGPIQSLGNMYNEALTAMAGAERVFGLLDTKPQWADSPDAQPIERINGHIECRNLCFAYDPGRPVLNDINIVAEPGQTVALVGPTGSGKSTLVNLIAKFYLPVSGEILIDGREIRSITGPSLHRQLGIIMQQNFLFTGTVMDNIRFSKPGATDDEVVAAARTLGCMDIIEDLSDGFATQVGERGASLSLGQRQLVCFTRAILADPRIVILDEATSSVDTMTEVRIQQALETLLRGRTCFVVAHRLSTVRHADQVLVLSNGRIVERGTHYELLGQDGMYTNLYRQFVRATEEESGGRRIAD